MTSLPALGIDLGLSGVRAAVVDRAGRLLGRGRVSAGGPPRAEGKAERDPREWLEQAIAAARQALAEAGCRGVAAIAIGALGPCPVLLDRELQPLAPAPLFSLDGRAEGHRQRLLATAGLDAERLGPDHALPKLFWWKENAPALLRAAAWVVDAAGFLAAAFAGRPVMDRITAEDYRLPAVEPPVPLPEPQAPDALAGPLTAAAAARLGIGAGAPVAVGSYDSFVDIAGTGTGASGEACVILGSTMILGAVVDRPIARAGLRSSRHLGRGWFFGGWTSSAGSLLDWAQAQLGEAEGVEDLPPGAGGLLALPYFAGERAPVWDPSARGALVGLTLESSRAQIRRAMIDAVALSALDLRRRMGEVAVRRWRLAGGGARSPALAQSVADAIGSAVELPAHAGEALSPALLAFRAIGHRLDPPLERRLEPDPARHRRYEALYGIYRGLYPALADSMHRLGRLAASGEAAA